jgi:hypothetical protein
MKRPSVVDGRLPVPDEAFLIAKERLPMLRRAYSLGGDRSLALGR